MDDKLSERARRWESGIECLRRSGEVGNCNREVRITMGAG